MATARRRLIDRLPRNSIADSVSSTGIANRVPSTGIADRVLGRLGSDQQSCSTSVVVPVYNDPEGLERTLESLIDQTTDDYEVVVADNGSTDRTSAVAREYARRNDRVRHVVEDDIQSSYAARNAGIEAAAGDVFGFVDADMWAGEDYVASITDTVGGDGHSYVGCDVELVADGGTVARFRAATGFPVETYLREHRFAPTCCLATTREVFEAVGRFDERLHSNGDLEFGRRVHDAGFELAFEPEITLYHPARSTLGELVAQNVRIGRGRIEVRRRHPDRLTVRHPLHPRNFLPVHPESFLDDVGDADPALEEIPAWYALACLLKWSRTSGQLQEWASI